jgi:hypothetical protein
VILVERFVKLAAALFQLSNLQCVLLARLSSFVSH